MTAPLDELLAASPLPIASGDKRARGSVVVVGGSPACPGAAILAGTAALRAGAGRVQLAVHPTVAPAVAAAFPEAFVGAWDHGRRQVPDDVGGRIARARAVLVGPGLLREPVTVAQAVAELVAPDVPLLLDAGAVAAAPELAAAGHQVVVAPNEREAQQLVGDADDLAGALADRLGGRPVAVRGVETVLADGDGGRWSQRTRVDGLGTAGSGDVLVGIAAALLATGADPRTALAWAVALHARAGQLAAAAVAPVGYLAREIADQVAPALSAARGT